jgi:hypothetical protein
MFQFTPHELTGGRVTPVPAVPGGDGAGANRSVSTASPTLLLAGSLVACGANQHPRPGETNCDEAGQEASNPQDAGCQETGTPGDGGDGTEGGG